MKCKYNLKCYRKNCQHYLDYRHSQFGSENELRYNFFLIQLGDKISNLTKYLDNCLIIKHRIFDFENQTQTEMFVKFLQQKIKKTGLKFNIEIYGILYLVKEIVIQIITNRTLPEYIPLNLDLIFFIQQIRDTYPNIYNPNKEILNKLMSVVGDELTQINQNYFEYISSNNISKLVKLNSSRDVNRIEKQLEFFVYIYFRIIKDNLTVLEKKALILLFTTLEEDNIRAWGITNNDILLTNINLVELLKLPEN